MEAELNTSVRESLSGGMMRRGKQRKFTTQNIKHLPTTTTAAASLAFVFFHHPSLIKCPVLHPPPILSSVSMALIGYSKAGTAGSTIDRHPSHPGAPGPSQTYKVFSKLCWGDREPLLTNIWRSALSGRVADGKFSHNSFKKKIFLLLPGRRDMQLSIGLCVSTCVCEWLSRTRVSLHASVRERVTLVKRSN